MTLYAGIDVGGTNLRIGVVEDVRLISIKRFHADFAQLCRDNAPEAAWQQIVSVLGDALDKVSQLFPDVASIGIGFPGFIDPATSRIRQSPNLPGLWDVDLAGDLSRRIGRRVVVENDAVAAAYGEYRMLPDAAQSLAYIGLGTGVGGGLIHDGKPYRGQHGAAMEIGHIIVEAADAPRPCGCGNRGCLEQYASASGVAMSYKLATGLMLDAPRIAELARSGDSHAVDAYALAGIYLGRVVAHLAKILDVGQFIIGGGVSNAWDLMEERFHKQLQADLIPVLGDNICVKISASSDEAGMLGAALLSRLS